MMSLIERRLLGGVSDQDQPNQVSGASSRDRGIISRRAAGADADPGVRN